MSLQNHWITILSPAHIAVDVEAGSKKRAFEAAGLLFEAHNALPAQEISECLFARERLGSTGLGYGVAIPHGRLKGLKQPAAAVVRLAKPIGFEAPDGKPVQLLFCLLVPESATQKHLELLSEMAQILSNAPLREQLLAAPTAQALYDLLAA